MEAPVYRLDQRVMDRRDKSIRGRVIAIHTHNTPVPEKVQQPPYPNIWRYLVLLDQPNFYTQNWMSEEHLEIEK